MLAKGWRRVGEGLAKDFLAPSNFAIPEAPVWKSGFVTPWIIPIRYVYVTEM